MTHGNDWDNYEKTEAVNLNTHEVTEAQEVDGLWVPKHHRTWYRLRNFGDDNNVETIRDHEVTEFTRGGVKPADLLVPFEPGVEVIDAVAEVSYVVKEDGKAEPRPLFVPSLGNARTADAADLAAALAANPINDIPDPAAPERQAALQRLTDLREARLRKADPLRGQAAPAFAAGGTWVHSEPLKWEDLKGKVVILEFFADWCAPCRNDLPLAQHLHESAAKGNIVVIGVHTAGSDRAAVDAFLGEMKLTFPVLIDAPAGRGGDAQVAGARAGAKGDGPAGFGATCEAYGVRGIPHSVVIGPDGKVVGRGTIHDAYELATSLAGK
jgi:thiol-disulfide isomerase/thioredoxin